MKYQLAARGGRVDGFGHAIEVNPLIPARRSPRSSAKATALAGRAANRQHISLSEYFMRPLRAGALRFAAASRFLDDSLTS
jgi:hypothetical protein